MLVKLQARFHMLKSPTEEGEALRGLLRRLNGSFQASLREARDACPIAFFKPSYEQALLLNAWVYGINFPICFASNRIGKTTCFIINLLLWCFPNDPGWLMFQEYIDHKDRRVRVIPRPPLRAMVALQEWFAERPDLYGNPNLDIYDHDNAAKHETSQLLVPGLYRPAYPAAPIQQGSSIWLGAPDRDWHKDIMLRRLKDWVPPYAIARWNVTDLSIQFDTRSSTNPKPTVIDIACKSYESRDEKWSGDAVAGIMLSEGFSSDILSEIKQRVAPHAFASWDYTPVEARNVGKKVQLAYRVFRGQEELPLRAHVWTKFKTIDTPEHIIPAAKKADLLRMWAGKDEGKARIEGDFFASSRQILSKLNKELHCLPWTFKELLDRIPNCLLFRSIDPGYDHPTAVCWAALAPNNCWYVYRFFSQKGLTIGERCRRIVELSNNSREKVSYGRGANDYYWQETHPGPDSEPYLLTVADYHVFQIDQSTGYGMDRNYAIEGIPLTESVHLSPEARALQLDSKFDPRSYPYSPHPVRGVPPGAGVYFLTGEPGVAAALERMEALFWDILLAGPNKGESKDKVPLHGDDELDALCQLTSGPFYYHTKLQPQRRQPKDTEPEPELAFFSTLNQQYRSVTSQQADLLSPLSKSGPGYF